jgi:hypothetical protein
MRTTGNHFLALQEEHSRTALIDSVRHATTWLTQIAQVQDASIPSDINPRRLAHRCWRGAIRGDYSVATRQWGFFCPVWHTGQAIKSLCQASAVLEDETLLDAARLGADFIAANRIDDPADEDHGLILAYEDLPDVTNTSAILECCDGLLHLSQSTGDERYRQWVLEALGWIARKMYRPGEGLFRDWYRPATREILADGPRSGYHDHPPGRPLLDDGMFLKGYQLSGQTDFRTVFYETAERLLAEEEPPGNWIRFAPCQWPDGPIHPRHAYWWSLPMLDAYEDSGDPRFFACAQRSANWYLKAMRRDGGIIRNTYRDFNTLTFNHCVSGSACAGLMFYRLLHDYDATQFAAALSSTVDYSLSMQFLDPQDRNLQGALLEIILPPRGTDASPYYIRDLATIFHVQLLCEIVTSVFMS